MAKKVMGYIKLQIGAGSATPQPPIGTALGPRGLNIMNFCKEFNAKTAQMEKGSPVPVVITYFQDKSFTFETKTPPVTYFLKKAAKIDSGSKTPGRGGFVGKVTEAQVREIAAAKLKDLNCDTVESAAAQIRGSARSIGLQVVE
jgi:large subunit ribosomal protein L11